MTLTEAKGWAGEGESKEFFKGIKVERKYYGWCWLEKRQDGLYF